MFKHVSSRYGCASLQFAQPVHSVCFVTGFCIALLPEIMLSSSQAIKLPSYQAMVDGREWRERQATLKQLLRRINVVFYFPMKFLRSSSLTFELSVYESDGFYGPLSLCLDIGVPANKSKAGIFLLEAAELGDLNAQMSIANAYSGHAEIPAVTYPNEVRRFPKAFQCLPGAVLIFSKNSASMIN